MANSPSIGVKRDRFRVLREIPLLPDPYLVQKLPCGTGIHPKWEENG
jgi:hypothetical protein